MANLTIAIDDELLRRARVRAVENGTSVNALVRSYLTSYAGDELAAARAVVLELARRSTASSGPAGRAWTRDELYDR
jgi:plasmid stability protein